MPDSSPHRGMVLATVALVLATAALGLSVWTHFRPSPDPAPQPSYTDAQRADAKMKICAATDVVRRGVSRNTNLESPGGPEDVTGALAVAANARLSMYDGGQYLLARLDPATADDLATAVRKFANDLLDIGAAATAGAQNSDEEQAARLRDAAAANTTIQELCR
ncbi:hypothetical protein M2272_003706 [Mycobacterium frederiksbergense]|uniref:Alanine and proline rich membrane protein n=1 Tax=Mycolicibacterium frederiksbergense TaxID=117567 RepID=A0ABT6L280_9MYCO|nr:hypothetical protein [Mycolicibacterium frederiksbergense]MDH6197053.1 hypothetical protein [Mycolicibacterium frederiksbergense]